MSKLTKQCDGELMATFKNEIDGDYLMKVTGNVLKSSAFRDLVNQGYFPISYKLAAHEQNYKTTISFNIAMIFYYDTLIYDNDEEKIKPLYSDSDYEEQLIHKAVEQLKYTPLLKPTEVGARATYYPIINAMFALTNYLYYNQLLPYIDEHPNYQEDTIDDFRVASFRQMLLTIQSTLAQVTIGDYHGDRASIRILIEDYFLYLRLHGNEEGIKEYIRYTDAQKEFDETGKFSEDFLKTIPKGANPVKYVDYGWIHSFVKKPKDSYNFIDLVYCTKLPSNEKKKWIDIYLNFSKHSHGELLNANSPEKEILFVATYLSDLLFKIGELYEKDFKINAVWNNIDLIYNLQEKVEEMYKILETSKRFLPNNPPSENNVDKTNEIE